MHDFVEYTWATISGIAFTLITVRIGLGWSTPMDITINSFIISRTGTQSTPMHRVVDVSADRDEGPMSEMKRGILMHTSDVTTVV